MEPTGRALPEASEASGYARRSSATLDIWYNLAMSAFTGPLIGLLLTGNYLLFWPIYRLLHPKETQRSQALFRLFLVELAIYVPLTTLMIVAIYKVPDFHHAFLIVEAIYCLLALSLWVATYGVWADNSPEAVT